MNTSLNNCNILHLAFFFVNSRVTFLQAHAARRGQAYENYYRDCYTILYCFLDFRGIFTYNCRSTSKKPYLLECISSV